jgi:hypothetical protein
MRAPRCLGSAAIVSIVSDDAYLVAPRHHYLPASGLYGKTLENFSTQRLRVFFHHLLRAGRSLRKVSRWTGTPG